MKMPVKRGMKAEQRKNLRAGFTLAEMLVALLILLMVSSVVAAGIPVAVRAYTKVTRSANAEVLLSTSVSALRDQLGTARDITVSEDKKSVTYFSDDTGSYSRIDLSSDPDQKDNIMITEYLVPELISGNGGLSGTGSSGANGGSGQGISRPLVSNAAATRELYITYGTISYENGIISISNLAVKMKISKDVLTSIEKLDIRTFGDIPAGS